MSFVCEKIDVCVEDNSLYFKFVSCQKVNVFFFLNTQGQGRLVCGVAGYKGHGGQVVKVMQLQESPYCKPLTGSCEVTESLRERKEH